MKNLRFSFNWDENILYIVIVSIFFYVPVMELQLVLFNDVFVKNSHLKFLVVFFVMLRIINRIYKNKVFIYGDNISKLMLLFIMINIFVLPTTFYFGNRNFVGLGSAISQNIYIFIIAFFFREYVDSADGNKIINLIKQIAFINVLVGFTQYITNDAIWPYVAYPDGSDLINSYNFYSASKVRSFGCLSSGYDLGGLLVVYYLFLLEDLVTLKKLKDKLLSVCLLIITTVVIYATYTRNIYLLFLYCNLFICFKYVFSYKFGKIFKLLYPLFMTTGLSCGLFFLKNVAFEEGILSSGSLMIRFSNWDMITSYMTENFYGFFFGFGKAQAAKLGFLSDNLYIDLILSTGFLGLAIWILILFGIYKNNIGYYPNLSNKMIFYLISSSMFFIGMLNIMETSYAFLGIALPCLKCFRYT